MRVPCNSASYNRTLLRIRASSRTLDLSEEESKAVVGHTIVGVAVNMWSDCVA
jgi:hypothetical protein